MSDPVADKSTFLCMYMSDHPDTLVAYVKYWGKVKAQVVSAKMSAIDSKCETAGMMLEYKVKEKGEEKKEEVRGCARGRPAIARPEKHGGSTHYRTYEEKEKDFADEKIHPGDLKASVTDAIVKLLNPIRQAYEESKEWQEIAALAYPDPNAKTVKKKKEKKYVPPPPGKGKNASKDPKPDAVPGDKVDSTVEATEPVGGEHPAES